MRGFSLFTKDEFPYVDGSETSAFLFSLHSFFFTVLYLFSIRKSALMLQASFMLSLILHTVYTKANKEKNSFDTFILTTLQQA